MARCLSDYLPKHYLHFFESLHLNNYICFGNLLHGLRILFPVNPFSSIPLEKKFNFQLLQVLICRVCQRPQH